MTTISLVGLILTYFDPEVLPKPRPIQPCVILTVHSEKVNQSAHETNYGLRKLKKIYSEENRFLNKTFSRDLCNFFSMVFKTTLNASESWVTKKS